jgi:hypothetical protein
VTTVREGDGHSQASKARTNNDDLLQPLSVGQLRDYTSKPYHFDERLMAVESMSDEMQWIKPG